MRVMVAPFVCSCIVFSTAGGNAHRATFFSADAMRVKQIAIATTPTPQNFILDIAPLSVHPRQRRSAFQPFAHGCVARSTEDDPERIGHALTGSFTLDVYGHTLDRKSNEDAAKRLGRRDCQSCCRSAEQTARHCRFWSTNCSRKRNGSGGESPKPLNSLAEIGCGGRI